MATKKQTAKSDAKAKKRTAKGDARAKMVSLFTSEDEVTAFKAAGYIPVLRWVKGFGSRVYKSSEVRASILRATEQEPV